jgi:hypothetical protein
MTTVTQSLWKFLISPLALLVVTLFSVSGFARGGAESTYFGILMGPDFVSYSTAGTATKTQFTGGVLYEQYFHPYFSMQPELRYTNKSVGPGNYEFLTIPALLKAHIPTDTLVTPNLATGPEFNFKVSGADVYKGFLFAWDFGAGLDAAISPKVDLAFDFRYSLGLTSIVSPFDQKPREVSLLFGAKFKL